MSALTPAERIKISMANESEYEKEIYKKYGEANVEKVPMPEDGNFEARQTIVAGNGHSFYYRIKNKPDNNKYL